MLLLLLMLLETEAQGVGDSPATQAGNAWHATSNGVWSTTKQAERT